MGDIDVPRELDALIALPLDERTSALAELADRLERELDETSRALRPIPGDPMKGSGDRSSNQ